MLQTARQTAAKCTLDCKSVFYFRQHDFLSRRPIYPRRTYSAELRAGRCNSCHIRQSALDAGFRAVKWPAHRSSSVERPWLQFARPILAGGRDIKVGEVRTAEGNAAGLQSR